MGSNKQGKPHNTSSLASYINTKLNTNHLDGKYISENEVKHIIAMITPEETKNKAKTHNKPINRSLKELKNIINNKIGFNLKKPPF